MQHFFDCTCVVPMLDDLKSNAISDSEAGLLFSRNGL